MLLAEVVAIFRVGVDGKAQSLLPFGVAELLWNSCPEDILVVEMTTLAEGLLYLIVIFEAGRGEALHLAK